MSSSRHLAVAVTAPAQKAYAHAADPRHLPQWAAGLARTIVEQVDGAWIARSPMGQVSVELTAPDDLGVLDHVVTLPDGERVLNAMRVIPDGQGCEVAPCASARR